MVWRGRGRSSQPRDDLAKLVTAPFEVLESVEAGAGGGKQHDLPRASGGRGEPGGVFEIHATVQLDAIGENWGELGGQAVGRGADQVAGDGVLAQGCEQPRERLALLTAPEDGMDAAIEGGEPDDRGGDVGRLRVVDEADAVDLGD